MGDDTMKLSIKLSQLMTDIDGVLRDANLSPAQRYTIMKVMTALYRKTLDPELIDQADIVADQLLKAAHILRVDIHIHEE